MSSIADSTILPLWTAVFFGVICYSKPIQFERKQLISADQDAECTFTCSPVEGNTKNDNCEYDCTVKGATFYTKEQRNPTTPSVEQPITTKQPEETTTPESEATSKSSESTTTTIPISTKDGSPVDNTTPVGSTVETSAPDSETTLNTDHKTTITTIKSTNSENLSSPAGTTSASTSEAETQAPTTKSS